MNITSKLLPVHINLMVDDNARLTSLHLKSPVALLITHIFLNLICDAFCKMEYSNLFDQWTTYEFMFAQVNLFQAIISQRVRLLFSIAHLVRTENRNIRIFSLTSRRMDKQTNKNNIKISNKMENIEDDMHIAVSRTWDWLKVIFWYAGAEWAMNVKATSDISSWWLVI